ncbi:hypothetical protein ACFQ2B_31150 [Streptomyces stramineus]
MCASRPRSWKEARAQFTVTAAPLAPFFVAEPPRLEGRCVRGGGSRRHGGGPHRRPPGVGPPRRAAPAAAGGTEAADNKPPAGFASWGGLAAAQKPLSEAANAIEDALGDSPAFSSLTVSVEDRSVTLYHKGDADQVEAAVAPQRAKGVRVELRSAPYNRSELKEAASKVMGQPLTIDGQPTTVHSAGARADGSGLLLQGEPLRVNGAARSAPRSVAPEVPWTGTVTEVSTTLDSREKDEPLHSGGMLLRGRYKGGPICTSGFVVSWPQRNMDYLMTAAHCEKESGSGKKWYAGDQDTKVGSISDSWEKYDTALIPTHGGNLHTFTAWAGQPIYRQPQSIVKVNRASHSYVGEYLCASGSLSGRSATSRSRRAGTSPGTKNSASPPRCTP